MGLLSRRKGHTFERWVATQLRQAFPMATVRRSDQGFGAFEPDIVISGVNGVVDALWLECYHGRAPDPLAKLRQAERDSLGKDRWPVVAWRAHGTRNANATMRYETLLRLHTSGMVGPSKCASAPITMGFDDFLRLINGEP